MMLTLLALSALARADAPDNWKLSLDGYYRTRGYIFPGLYQDQTAPGTYMTSRLRLQPMLNFNDEAKFMMMVDALDGVVWGDNESVASTALFAGDPSTTTIEGTTIDPITVRRAWIEFKVPIGLVRVGRQGSNWGMGILANEGNGFDDTFGENKYGSTYDRAIFATRPITVASAIANKIAHKEGGIDVPLIAAVGVDRLVEDPLIQYYGYVCDGDDTSDDVENGGRCVAGEDHGFSEDRTDSQRNDTWWVDTNDDVWEMIYVLLYKGDGLTLGSQKGDINVGVYGVNRKQKETDSNILIADAYAKVNVAGIYAEGEVLHIGGHSKAITLPGVVSYSPDTDPLYKDVDIWGYVARAGYQNKLLTAYLEHGYAEGDDSASDEHFTGRALHPDYNVGLVLYEEILSRVTATTWSDEAKGLWSNGGVYNSRYLYPTVKVHPKENVEIDAAFLSAWPDKPNGSQILCREGDKVDCAQYLATKKAIGWEADLGAKLKFHDHMNFSLEAGYAHVTDRVPLETTGLKYQTDADGHNFGNYFTLQSRIAYEF